MKLLKISLGICFVIIGLTISKAQEFSITANSGIQGLDYKVFDGDNQLKIGGKVGVGYTYFINQNWGVLTGIELGFYKNNSTLLDKVYTSNQIDSEGDAFEYRLKTKGYTEDNHFYAANIPLMLQYRTSGKTQFYINGGGRVVFPFGQKTKLSVEEVKMSGYYKDYNVEIVDVPSHGFGSLTNWKSNSETKLKTAFALSGETGVSFKLSNKMRLYTGLYIDYGLNDIQKKSQLSSDIPLINYNAESIEAYKLNGIIKTSNAIDEAKLLAYGVQVRLGFGSYKSKKIKPLENKEELILETFTTDKEKIVESTITATEKYKELSKAMTSDQRKMLEELIIFKNLGNNKLSEDQKFHLRNVATILTSFPEVRIVITGYTCDVGTDTRNNEVGLERAKKVGLYLEEEGISATRVEIKSAGSREPIVPNNSESNRQQNRRVEIRLIE